jgi:ABC-type oligopeptide transport system substrate-binding subunit
MYTPNIPPWLQETQIVQRDLKPLGIDVEVKEFPVGDYFRRLQLRHEPFDLAVSGWLSQSTDPAQTLDLFDSTSVGQGNDVAHFTDPAFNRAFAAASKLSGTDATAPSVGSR